MRRRIIIERRGSASIEFVWCAIVLVVLFLFMFQIFQATMHSSGGLVKSRLNGFTSLDRPSGAGHKSIIMTNDLSGGYSGTRNCTSDCSNKINFSFVGPNTTYSYGIDSFDMQVKRSFVVNLQ